MIELKDHNGSEYASARELHQALGIVKQFTGWMNYNLERAELEEGEDFYTKLAKSTGGRPQMDWYLTEQSAIGIIMMSGGKNAKIIRKAVIEAFQQKQTIQSTIKGDEENAAMYTATRDLLLYMGEKYDVEPTKLLIGMQYGEMIVQVYDEGAYPVWQTLELIKLPIA